jgi:hypothetical protein
MFVMRCHEYVAVKGGKVAPPAAAAKAPAKGAAAPAPPPKVRVRVDANTCITELKKLIIYPSD